MFPYEVFCGFKRTGIWREVFEITLNFFSYGSQKPTDVPILSGSSAQQSCVGPRCQNEGRKKGWIPMNRPLSGPSRNQEHPSELRAICATESHQATWINGFDGAALQLTTLDAVLVGYVRKYETCWTSERLDIQGELRRTDAQPPNQTAPRYRGDLEWMSDGGQTPH